MMPLMRTTLTLDEDIARIARELAHEQNKSLGTVISELARKGLTAGTPYTRNRKNALPTFVVREDSPRITLSDVKRDEDEA